MTRSRLSIWSITIVVAVGAPHAVVSAQRPPQALRHMHHTTWGAIDGLSPTGAGPMQRSGDGYLWLHARTGLQRFDGQRFHLVDSVEVPELRTTTAGWFFPLTVDRDGVMWVSRPDGALLRYQDGKFTIVMAGGKGRRVSSVVQDGSGRRWITARGGLFLFENGRLVRSGITPTALDTANGSIIADTSDGVWIGAQGAVWHVSGNRAQRFDIPNPVPRQYANPLRQLRDGTLWVDGPDLMTMRDGHWSTIRYENNQIHPSAVAESPDHHALIATRGHGLLRAVGRRLERLTSGEGLSSAVLKDVLTDNEGSIWISTEAGLDRLRTVPFITLGKQDGVPFDAALSIEADATGGLWIDTWDSGRLFHATGGLAEGRDGPVQWNTTSALGRVGNYQLIGRSRSGGVWAMGRRGNDRTVLRRVLPRGGPPQPAIILPTSSNIAAEDRSGRLWISLAPRGFRQLHDGRVDSIALPVRGREPYVQWVAVDSVGHAWASNSDAAILYEFVDGRLVWQLDSSSGLTRTVERIRAAGGDTLWLVLAGGSLGRLVGHTLREIPLPAASNLLRSNGVAIVPTREFFWMASPYGIARVNTADLNAYADARAPAPMLRFFDREDGLAVPGVSGGINRHGATMTRDGHVWFSTPAGVAVYDPELEEKNTVAPHATIEEIDASGRRVLYDSLAEIPPAADRVDIHFSAPSLRIPSRVRIEYQLEGVDRGWKKANALRFASYSQLRPGHFRFRVRAWNEDGVPSIREATLALHVKPRWFETTWFIGIALLMLACGGPLVLNARARTRAKSREQRLRERFEATLAERARLSRELHDTLLQGFTGITLKLQAVRATIVSAPEAAADTLSRVLDESDVALLDARQMIWDMRLSNLEDRDLCDAIEDSGRQMVADASIAFGVNVCGTSRRLSPRIESVVYRIGREAIANALKHARASVIAVELTYESQALRMTVRDDGVGLPAGSAEDAARRGHFGIVGMRERAARAGGVLSIASIDSGGTEILLTIPTSDEGARI